MIECHYYKHGGCKPCEVCGAEPFNINTTCRRCFECENKSETTRWGDNFTAEIEMLRQIIMLVNERLDEIKEEREKEQQVKVLFR